MSNLEYLKKAYDVGCDDYIKKPFDIEELELRINYLIKKSGSIVALRDGYSFDMRMEKLFRDKREINLNRNEQKLLYLLIKNIGQTIPNDSIMDYIWDRKDVCSNTLRTTIKKLRDKLKSNFIVNVRGVGYKIEV
jgi:DNA-binding response OmpR family regulator